MSVFVCVCVWQKMPEEQAFAVLVKIMFNYGHRNMFRCKFQNLHLMFFQLERLMEVRGRVGLCVKGDVSGVYVCVT